jgi:hypothetical protein
MSLHHGGSLFSRQESEAERSMMSLIISYMVWVGVALVALMAVATILMNMG